MVEFRECEVEVTTYDMDYVLMPYPHLQVKIKCSLIEDRKKSIKFFLPIGEERLSAFLSAVVKVKSISQVIEKRFQILCFENHIYGFCANGGDKWLPAIPYRDYENKKLLDYKALESLITECIRTEKPCYVEML